MTIKLVCFDVDSTLTAGPGLPIVDSAVEAITQLQKKGIKVAIATGRPHNGIPVIEGKIFPDYYIAANGSIIADGNKKVIWSNKVDKEVFDSVNDYCQENNLGFLWKYVDSTYIYSPFPQQDFIKDSLGNCFVGHNPDTSVLPTAGALVTDENNVERFRQKFDFYFKTVYGGLILYDVDQIGVDKGSGLEKICELMKIELTETMAFGDSQNDIAMLIKAGISIAMGNGVNEAKEVADYITADAKDDGIIKALKKYKIL